MLSGINLRTAERSIGISYRKNEINLNISMSRIASGKRVSKPSDDLAEFFRAQTITSKNNESRVVLRDISEGIGVVNMTVNAGQYLLDKMRTMQQLVDQYYDPDTDDQARTYLRSEFDTIKQEIQNQISDTYYDSKQLIADSSASPIRTISLNPYNSSQTFRIAFTSSDVPDVSALDITAGEAAATAAVDAETVKAGSYLAKASAFKMGLEAQYRIAQKNIDKSEEIRSEIQDTNQAKEILKFTKQQIIQQASIAMLSQANMVRNSVLVLFGL